MMNGGQRRRNSAEHQLEKKIAQNRGRESMRLAQQQQRQQQRLQQQQQQQRQQ